MAYALRTVQGARAVTIVGTRVAPDVPVPDNCHTVLLFNAGPAMGFYAEIAPGPGALAINRMAQGDRVVLNIGTAKDRASGTDFVLAFDSIVAPTTFFLTYISSPQT